MSLLARMSVVWLTGQGNRASKRGKLTTAVSKYRSARAYAVAKNLPGDAVIVGMLLADELKSIGNFDAAIVELEHVIADCEGLEKFFFAGRSVRGSEIAIGALEELVSIAKTTQQQPMIHTYLERLLTMANDFRKRRLAADAMGQLGDICRESSDHPAAQRWYRDAASEFAALADIGGQATIYRSWARSVELVGDRVDALRLYEQSLAYYRQTGDIPNQANGHGLLGDARRALGDFPGACAEYEAAANLFRQASDSEGEARAVHLLGQLVEEPK